jgi:hypothetical protein
MRRSFRKRLHFKERRKTSRTETRVPILQGFVHARISSDPNYLQTLNVVEVTFVESRNGATAFHSCGGNGEVIVPNRLARIATAWVDQYLTGA